MLLGAVQLALERSEAVLRLQADMQELQERYAQLSRREQEVMTLIVRGLLNKQVGYELGISEITVKAHRGKVMEKKFEELLKQAKEDKSQAPPKRAFDFD